MLFLMLGLLIISTALSAVIYTKGKKLKDKTTEYLSALLAIIILAVGMEISVFNINFYTSHSYEAIDLSQYIYLSDEITKYDIISDTTLEFPEINEEIHNIKITFSETSPSTLEVTPLLTDDANKFYYSTPTRTIYKNVPSSHYINIQSVGTSSDLAFTFHSDDSDTFKIKSISINEARPFEFSLIRLVLLSAALILIYIFKPTSPIYTVTVNKSKHTKTDLTIAFLSIQCIIFVFLGTLNPAFLGIEKTDDGFNFVPLEYIHHNQYDELAQAILQGKTYIDDEDVPQSLIEMKNPYDKVARNNMHKATGDTYRWDVAYFDGHYYVYFGIVPMLIMYLPFRLIFDAPFPTAIGIILFASIFAIGVFKLLGLLCEKYFKTVSIGVYILTSLAFVNCCGAMFLVKRPDFYSIPIITGMAFVTWGLYLWLKGKSTEKKQNAYFLLGSLCCALAVGCRPQSVLMCAVAIPLFLPFFIKEKKLFEKKGVINLVCLGIPFVVIAAGIMYYNYIRFDSPFDFGSGYNLTTNDVTKRGFNIGRTGLGLFTYLFQTPNFTATFPYLKETELETAFMGRTIAENCFGGLFAVTPVLWFTFLIGKAKNTLKDKKLFGLTIVAIFVGIATVIADTQAGGLLQRYYSDFGYIFFIAASIVIFALFEKNKDGESNKNIVSLLFISTIFSFLYTLCLVFSVSDVTIDTERPTVFGTIKHLVEFWL